MMKIRALFGLVLLATLPLAHALPPGMSQPRGNVPSPYVPGTAIPGHRNPQTVVPGTNRPKVNLPGQNKPGSTTPGKTRAPNIDATPAATPRGANSSQGPSRR